MNTNSAFVHVSNADGTPMNAEISDNIIYGTKTPALVEDAVHGVVTGTHNWIQTNAGAGTLAGSVQSGSPGFKNAAANDFRPAAGSACIGAADASIYGLPGREYYLNEATNREWRIRAAARDIGAFESTSTNGPVGPYDPTPLPRLNITRAGSTVVVSWPLFAQDFHMDQSALTNPIAWVPASYSCATNATNVFVTVSTPTNQSFFRLRK